MAAPTAAQIIATAQRTLPDLGQTTALDLLNIVVREVLAELPEIRRDNTTVALVAGTQEYALDDLTFQVDQVWWANAGGTAWLSLGQTSIEYLEKEDTLWRSHVATSWIAGAQPSIDFYVTTKIVTAVPTLVIGFNYPPDTATATGTLTVFQSRLQSADLGINDSVVGNLVSKQVFVDGLLYYASREIRPALASAFQQAYSYQLALNRMFIRTRNEGLKRPQFVNIRSAGTEWPGDSSPTQNGGDSASSGQ